LEIDSKLLCFEKCFKEIITKLRQNPGSYGQLSVRSLLNLREQVNFSFSFNFNLDLFNIFPFFFFSVYMNMYQMILMLK